MNVQQMISTVQAVLPDARRALRKPAVIGNILLTAHRAQITLGLLLIFMVFLAPTIVDFVTSMLFPPETSKLLGFIKTHQENSLKVVADVFVMTILWIASIGYPLLLTWFRIPDALVRANVRSRSMLADAEAVQCTDKTKSRALYKRALSLATDPKLESELESRLREGAFSFASSSSCDDTKVNLLHDTVIGSDTLVSSSQPTSHSRTSQTQVGLDGRYKLGSELGKGAMGVVWSAWDNVLDRKVALKQLSLVLTGDDEYATRFRREAKALARLAHPNVVQVYDLIEDGSRLWMVLELVDGGDLATYLKNHGCLSINEAVNTVVPVAEGLGYAHSQGIVHRDLKPSNILLTSDLTPKISDFGIAKLTQSSKLTQVGSVLGSPPYMSPEQCSGSSIDARSDIYSLGITLYELLAGKVPFEGDTSSVLARQIVEQPTPLSEILSEIPVELEKLILQMLAKNPDQRPADMTMVISLLSSFKNKITV